MPEPDYGGNREALDRRQQMVLQYGADTVIASEVATVCGLMFTLGLIRPGEFGDLVEMQCKKVDDRRRRAAGFD